MGNLSSICVGCTDKGTGAGVLHINSCTNRSTWHDPPPLCRLKSVWLVYIDKESPISINVAQRMVNQSYQEPLWKALTNFKEVQIKSWVLTQKIGERVAYNA